MDHDPGAAKAPHSVLHKLKSLNWRFVITGVIAVIVSVPVLIIVCLAPIISRPLYDQLIFHPFAYPDGADRDLHAQGVAPENVYFQSLNGNKLHGLLYVKPGAKRIVLINHGNAANIFYRANLADLLMQTGCSVFAYDYSGYGCSQGKPSVEGLNQDADGAYQYLLDKNYKPEQIILFGESIGTLVTGEQSRKKKCAAIILQSPIYSLQKRARKIFPFLQIYPDWSWFAPGTTLNNASAMSVPHPPLLLVAGTADQQTPIDEADELYAAACEPKKYVRIEGAGHGDKKMMDAPIYKEKLTEFIDGLQ